MSTPPRIVTPADLTPLPPDPLPDEARPPELLGGSRWAADLPACLDRIAASDEPVLIRGASGSGRRHVARALRDRWRGGRARIASIEGRALGDAAPEPVEGPGAMERELCDALESGRGSGNRAPDLMLVLEDPVHLPPVAWLRILDVVERQRIRIGHGVSLSTGRVRIVAITLPTGSTGPIPLGAFVSTIALPPLRERADDVAPLARHFVARASRRADRTIRLRPSALAALRAYPWPGNVGELRCEIERAVAVAEGDTIRREHLSARIRSAGMPAGEVEASLRETLDGFERRLVLQALSRYGQNVPRTARHLGVSPAALRRRLRRWVQSDGVESDRGGSAAGRGRVAHR